MTVEPGLRLVSTDLLGRLEAVLDGLGDGITVPSPTGELLYANAAAAGRFASAADLLATPVEQVFGRFELLQRGQALPRRGRHLRDPSARRRAAVSDVRAAVGFDREIERAVPIPFGEGWPAASPPRASR